MEKYVKGIQDIKINNNLICHSQKSYVEILGVPYLALNSSATLITVQVEQALSHTRIFKEVTLASKSCIIKASPKIVRRRLVISLFEYLTHT